MKISELARAAQTPVGTVRHYEREGLLPAPARTTGNNYRRYDAAQVERLGFIRHCRALGMTLDEIRVLLHHKGTPQARCDEVNALLDEHIGHVEQRLRELEVLREQLQALRQRCDAPHDAAHCGILRELSRPLPGAMPVDAPCTGDPVTTR